MSAERIITKDVNAAFRRYVTACEALNHVASDQEVVLTTGSKVNGIAFRVALVSLSPGRTSGHYAPPAGDDFLGMTKSEAFYRLADRASVLEDVQRALK